MVNAINGSNSQLYASIRTQEAGTQKTLQLENYTEKNAQRVKNAATSSSELNKRPTIQGESFSTLLKAQEAVTTNGVNGDSFSSAVAKSIGGDVNLDERFSNEPQKFAKSLNLMEAAQDILLPTAENVKAIAAHAGDRLKDLLVEYNIPQGPSKITYDNTGHMQLPSDYAYKEELTQALEENPGLARELSSLNALSSHAAGLKQSLAFSAEYSQAPSRSQAEAIIAKYPDLFSGGSHDWNIALNFSDKGDLFVTAGGKEMKFS